MYHIQRKNIIINFLRNKIDKKKALITGVTGQDGVYLSYLLLKNNYEVHGIKRRSSFNTGRLDNIYNDLMTVSKVFFYTMET